MVTAHHRDDQVETVLLQRFGKFGDFANVMKIEAGFLTSERDKIDVFDQPLIL